jgi:antitoxin YefM
VLAILPWELYESIVETLEILGDEEQMAELRQSIQEAAEGKGESWEAVKKELGWK